VPAVAVVFVGVPGAPTTAEFDAADAPPCPTLLLAVTEHVYVFAFVSEGTTIGLAAPDALPKAPPFDETQRAV
jgi:hypothetical protein